MIKIESQAGDEVRGWGPPFARGMASYFINVNRNKKSIILDLSIDEGAPSCCDCSKMPMC